MPDLCVWKIMSPYSNEPSPQHELLTAIRKHYLFSSGFKGTCFGRENSEISYSFGSFEGNILAALICEGLHRTWELSAPICHWHYLIYSFVMFQLLRFQGKWCFWIPEKNTFLYLQLILLKLIMSSIAGITLNKVI